MGYVRRRIYATLLAGQAGRWLAWTSVVLTVRQSRFRQAGADGSVEHGARPRLSVAVPRFLFRQTTDLAVLGCRAARAKIEIQSQHVQTSCDGVHGVMREACSVLCLPRRGLPACRTVRLAPAVA